MTLYMPAVTAAFKDVLLIFNNNNKKKVTVPQTYIVLHVLIQRFFIFSHPDRGFCVQMPH